MFGYHDSNRCAFDLWAPVQYDDTAVQNRAFSSYCYHSQEIEDAIIAIGNGIDSLDFDMEMTDDDMRYIEEEVKKRYGMTIHVS